MEATQEVTITVRADHARLMAEALFEMRRDWLDARDQATERGDTKGAGFEQMHVEAAEGIAGSLHAAGWDATTTR